MEMTVLINVIIHTPSNDYKPYTTFNGSESMSLIISVIINTLSNNKAYTTSVEMSV